jgi:hypothetical protein
LGENLSCIAMDPVKELSQRIRVLTWVVGVGSTLVIGLLAFLAFLKDRDLDNRVRGLEDFKRLQIKFNEGSLKVR